MSNHGSVDRRRLRASVIALSVLLFAACDVAVGPEPASATGSINDHVTFYGVGKVARYQQHMDSSLEFLDPLFVFSLPVLHLFFQSIGVFQTYQDLGFQVLIGLLYVFDSVFFNKSDIQQ